MTAQRVKQVATFLLCALIFLAPTNLFMKGWEHTASINGLVIDYLLPKFYLSDIPILGFIGVGIWQARKNHRLLQPKWLGVIFGFLVLRQFTTFYPVASLWFLVKLGELGALAWALSQLVKNLNLNLVYLTLLLTIIFQSSLGLLQFVTQKSLMGYYFLGEAQLHQFSGITRGVFASVEKILPYGTTAHPNLLAGTMVIYLLVTVNLAFKIKNGLKFWLITAIPALTVLLLTQSQAAWLTLGIGGIFFLLPKHLKSKLAAKAGILLILGLVMTVVTLTGLGHFWPEAWSWQRRVTLNHQALKLFMQNPIWGTGLNTNAALNERIFAPGEIARFAQPTHHVGLIWLSEMGLLGIIFALSLWKKFSAYQKLFLLSLLPLLSLDHYLLTLQSGQLVLVIGLFLSLESWHERSG